MPTATKPSAPNATTLERQHWSQQVARFLRGIGIEVEDCRDGEAAKGFLPQVRIVEGRLVADLAQVFPGDVLHEAAHMAVIPAPFRQLAHGTLKRANDAMHAYLAEHGDGLTRYPEDPLCRAILQADENEATAWQYAAAVAMGLPEQWLFPEGSYSGDSENVLLSLKASTFMGIHGLQAAGWTCLRANPHRPVPVYPELAFWLHPGAGASSSNAAMSEPVAA